MFLVAFVVLSFITVPLAGGQLSRLSDTRLRWTPAIVSSLAIQVVITSLVPSGDPTLHRALHLGSYVLAAAFLFANRKTPGLPVIALGALLNVVAIVANNGLMPASAGALRAAGELTSSTSFLNSALVTHPRLLFLGDIFAIPKAWPLHNVFSIGDVSIALGAAIAIHTLSGSRLTNRRIARDRPAVLVD